jgi:sulfite reductase (NADPH) flavoprotein alpha-component
MQQSFGPVPRQRANTSGGLARWLGALAFGLAVGAVGALLALRAGLPHLPAGGAMLVALSAVLAWFVIAAWQRRVALQPQPQPLSLPLPPPTGPVVCFDRAAKALSPAAYEGDAGPRPAEALSTPMTLQVAFASQTGFAEQLAGQTAQQLQRSGLLSAARSLGSLDIDDLRSAGRLLFVVSTTGDGDAPDDALSFFDQHMAQAADLSSLEYGILALGDRDYDDFCGFGHKLDRWLQASGAQALFDLIEVDSEDEAALRQWQYQLAALGGDPDQPDWQAPRYQNWELLERRLMNPGSLGAPCFQLALRPMQGKLYWEAGDVIEIGPCQAPAAVTAWLERQALDGTTMVMAERKRLSLRELLARSRLPQVQEVAGLDAGGVAAILQRLPHRAYSIASLPEDGAAFLLVRQMRGADGQLGLGSRWLTEAAEVGTGIAARIRDNTNFHVPEVDCPLILIGTGTGMAALRALLKAQLARSRRRNWLLFGERQAGRDCYYGDELRQWLAEGKLERADFAWSRDQPDRRYVQQLVRESATALGRWVDDGAAIYVCGNAATMAPAVDQALREALGAERLGQLRSDGRYRRDVY